MGKQVKMKMISILLLGACALVLVNNVPECQGAKYVNSLDLSDDEMSSLLDELSKPEHRLNKDKPKTFSWFSLRPSGPDASRSRYKPVYYEYEKPTSRRRRIVKRQRQMYQSK